MRSDSGAKIDILLPFYEGEAYFPEMLDSLKEQSLMDFRLLVRDDGSRVRLDRLPELPFPAELLPSHRHVGVLEAVNELYLQSSAPYLMFCDQDDVWFKSKVELTLRKMQEAEQLYGAGTPLLVFTDMSVTDRNLFCLSGSFYRYARINPAFCSLERLLTQNVPSACTIMINRAAASLAFPLPPEAVMHDHWLSLCVAAFGKIVYLDCGTMFYRQHGSNVFGIEPYGLRYLLRMMGRGLKTVRARFLRNVTQAGAFLERYGGRLDRERAEHVRAFASIGRQGFWKRRYTLLSAGILKSGFLRNLGTMLVI